MSRLADLEALRDKLNLVDATNAKENFTALFQEGYRLLDFDLQTAAEMMMFALFPPASRLILSFLQDEVVARIASLRAAGQV